MSTGQLLVRDEHGRSLPLARLIAKGGRASVWASEGPIAVKILQMRTPRAAERLRDRIGVVRRFNLADLPVSRPLDLLGPPDIGYSMELPEKLVPIQDLTAVPADRDLLDWYAETGGLRRRLRLLAGAADALAALHARGVVYADPSPRNVLISPSEADAEVRLSDVNLLQSESVILDRGATVGYAAPEVITGRNGVTCSSDAFALAVIAFEVLALTHPFLGDLIRTGEPELRERAYAGELPWIDHPDDGTNRSNGGLPRGSVFTPILQRLASATLAVGLHQPRKRASVGEWATALHGAADMTLDCAGCPQAKDAELAACPWCGTPAPDPVVAIVEVAVPGWPDPVPAQAALAVPSATWLTVTARTACLDRTRRGPAAVAWLRWQPGERLTVRNPGPMPLWLAPELDPVNVIVLEPAQELALPADETVPQWTVHFGSPQEAHRLLRFSRLRVRREVS